MKKVNLSNLSLSALSKDATSKIVAGQDCVTFGMCGSDDCRCACAYSDSGGSSTNGNGSANFDGGLSSPGCD